MTVPDYLDDLDAEQLAAVQAIRGPVCIVAGAGTGKTRTITHRIAHAVSSGTVDPRTALAITHSRKAAAELSSRLTQLGVATVDARTFHAAGLRIAGQFWARTGRPGAAPKLASSRDTWGLWRDALRAVSPDGTDPDTAALRDVVDEVSWARSRLVGMEDYPAAAVGANRHPGIAAATVVDAWASFSQAKREREVVDFADLLELAADLLVSDADVAARVQRRWSYVTVDEYQDTDPAQQRLLDAVLGSGDDICVVGDPRQAIYAFKGADPSYLRGFVARYRQAQVFELRRNYRSTPQILEWANRIAIDSKAKALIATRASGALPRVTRCEDEGAETRWVVARVALAIADGTPASEIAVLYRFNSTQARFEAAFAQGDIAAAAEEDTTFFDRPEVAAVLAAVGQAAVAGPEQPAVRVLEMALARVGFRADAPPAGQGAARARWESQQALLDLVTSWPESAGADAAGLVRHLDALAARTHEPRGAGAGPGAGVTLATLHRAKGLEWDIVFIVGAHDGAIPASYATTAEEEAEEERLLHVGMTRARRELHFTWAATSARGWTNKPSPYLDALAGQKRPAAGAGAKRERGGGPAALPKRGAGSECPHCTEVLKGIAARRLGVCAHCVTQAPGAVGERARGVAEVVERAAAALGVEEDGLVGGAGLLRLLDQRPGTMEEVCATAGVNLPPKWAQEVADALVD